jgi:hypothetical protein
VKYQNKDKSEWLAALRDMVRQWTDLIDGLSAEQISAVPDGDYSVKEAIGHNWAWEQLTIAMLEAALEDREMRFTLWPEPYMADNDAGEAAINANIQALTRDRAWDQLYADWQATMQRVIDLTGQIAEDDLMQPGRYPFMGGGRLMGQMAMTWDHHGEHLRDLKAHLDLASESK